MDTINKKEKPKMKVKNAGKILVTSIMAIAISFSLLIGSTFAWFTDSSSTGINKIQSGNLDVNLAYTNSFNGVKEDVNAYTKVFTDINGDDIVWEPGASANGRFEVSNDGSLALKYQLSIVSANATLTPTGKTLADALSIYALTRDKSTGTDMVMGDSSLQALQIDSAVPEYDPANMPSFKDGLTLEAYLLPQESITYEIGIVWQPSENDNEFNVAGGLSIDFAVGLVATQVSYENDGDGFFYDSNASLPSLPEIPPRESKWDGTVDTTWYNQEETVFEVDTAEEFAGFARLAGTDNFEGKTVKLGADIDLGLTNENGESVSFEPIGSTGQRDDRGRLVTTPFKGTFDGQGNTISNLYQSGWAFGYEWGQYGSVGLFSQLDSATIKNVNLSGVEVQIEGGDVGGICGSAEGNCTFENITIEDCDFGTYNNGIGGIIGWSGAGVYNFKDITIAEDVVLGGLWGSFDSSIGGVVGQAEIGATYNFENVEVSCRLDAYNDVIAAYKYYQYRMCGMLIGRCEATTTIDGKNCPDLSQYNLSFKNVTVNYGDWMNYHYCVVEGKTAWRVEPGYAYGGIPTDHDHSTCAVCCNLLLPFDQLIGGDQLGITPIRAIDGVTVNYPASYNPDSNN